MSAVIGADLDHLLRTLERALILEPRDKDLTR